MKPPVSRQAVILRDIALVGVALIFTEALRSGFHAQNFAWSPMLYGLPAVVLLSFFTIRLYKVDRIQSVYLGLTDFVGMAKVAFSGSVLWLLTEVLVGGKDPFHGQVSSSILFGFLTLTFFSMARWLSGHGPLEQRAFLTEGRGRRMLIIGAGGAGEMVVRETSKLASATKHIAGFLDDDPLKQGTTLHGVPVLGTVDDLVKVAEAEAITDIIIAIPSLPNDQQRALVKKCSATKARIRMMPSMAMLVAPDRDVLPIIRDLNLEDLLGRDALETPVNDAARYVSGEVVMITGGGGSIGSELARQTAALAPSALVLVGKGENSIFEIDLEIRQKQLCVAKPIICDVRDKMGIDEIVRTNLPAVIFHAAAHKHVPLMEAVPIEAIRNNVFGTLNMAETALRHGVKRFILVSTDKAVKPSNVMGATKRVAEMIVSAMASRGETNFAAVRFGNVLGSRGSLIPILKKQVEKGGPITITHPDMTRFFMTIPEAAQLIVQAGAMGSRGEVFILDMGEPVKIVDIAHDLIRMSGLVPGQDIEIVYTGIRPGEKIHEELSYATENVEECDHPKIMRVSQSQPVEWLWLKGQLDQLAVLCEAGDVPGARSFLMDLAWGKNLPPMTMGADRSEQALVDVERHLG